MAIKKGDKKEAEVLLDELKTWIEMKTSLVKQAQDTHYQFMDAIEKIDQVANFEAPPESPNVD